jgi:hypothetical protein
MSIAIIRGVLAMPFSFTSSPYAPKLVILSAAKDPLPLPSLLLSLSLLPLLLLLCLCRCFLARHPDRAKRRGIPTAATSASLVLQVYRPNQLSLLHG